MSVESSPKILIAISFLVAGRERERVKQVRQTQNYQSLLTNLCGLTTMLGALGILSYRQTRCIYPSLGASSDWSDADFSKSNGWISLADGPFEIRSPATKNSRCYNETVSNRHGDAISIIAKSQMSLSSR